MLRPAPTPNSSLHRPIVVRQQQPVRDREALWGQRRPAPSGLPGRRPQAASCPRGPCRTGDAGHAAGIAFAGHGVSHLPSCAPMRVAVAVPWIAIRRFGKEDYEPLAVLRTAAMVWIRATSVYLGRRNAAFPWYPDYKYILISRKEISSYESLRPAQGSREVGSHLRGPWAVAVSARCRPKSSAAALSPEARTHAANSISVLRGWGQAPPRGVEGNQGHGRVMGIPPL